LPRYGFRRSPLDRYDRHEAIGRWINARATPGDTVCVRGLATPIYQVTGLRCPSRFFSQDTVGFGLPEWTPEERQDLLDRPPTFLVTFSDRRAEIRDFEGRGYVLHDEVEAEGRVRYVVLVRADRDRRAVAPASTVR
jgi:hypothetical protein